jgi:hypothetical protein
MYDRQSQLFCSPGKPLLVQPAGMGKRLLFDLSLFVEAASTQPSTV